MLTIRSGTCERGTNQTVRHARERGHPGSIGGINGKNVDSRLHGNDETTEKVVGR